MSDTLPKVKAYIFVSIVQLVMNLVCVIFSLTTLASASNLATTGFGSSFASFVPFISLADIVVLHLDVNFAILFGVATGIFSAIQTYVIAVVIAGWVSNLVWHPDL